MTPRVSVLMPVHNGAAHIAAAVRSVLAQTYRDFELVVVDDGSTDESVAVVERLVDARVRVVRREKAGIVGALNAGLDEVRGEFVARFDADDLMAPERLARQVAFLDARPGVVACGTAYAEFGAGSAVVRMPRSAAACRARLAFGTCVAHSAATIRTRALENVRYRPEYEFAEDYRLFSELSEIGDLANLPYVGLHYRTHAAQISAARAATQRALTVRIAAENLARAGVSTGEDVLAGVIWPGAFGRYLTVQTPRALALGARAGGVAGAVDALRFARERLNTALRSG
ncbi:glycosyltransferase family 2 protein [Lentzea sp. NPDC058450]|uniref:glycosyltransferase family 2 protein n=1 Tax=Lentzea sp. NPDC058450 TaxID=3346505 RepID=UPI00366856C7